MSAGLPAGGPRRAAVRALGDALRGPRLARAGRGRRGVGFHPAVRFRKALRVARAWRRVRVALPSALALAGAGSTVGGTLSLLAGSLVASFSFYAWGALGPLAGLLLLADRKEDLRRAAPVVWWAFWFAWGVPCALLAAEAVEALAGA